MVGFVWLSNPIPGNTAGICECGEYGNSIHPSEPVAVQKQFLFINLSNQASKPPAVSLLHLLSHVVMTDVESYSVKRFDRMLETRENSKLRHNGHMQHPGFSSSCKGTIIEEECFLYVLLMNFLEVPGWLLSVVGCWMRWTFSLIHQFSHVSF